MPSSGKRYSFGLVSMKVILNADDFGMTHEANLGIKKALTEGFASQTSVVVNTNYFDEAVDIAERYGFKDRVGLHINLFEGTPLTGGIKKHKRYAFYDMFRYNPNKLQKYFPMDVDVLRAELEAQIEKYLSGGFTLMNIDSHHCAFYDASVLAALLPLLKKYKFRSIRYIGNSYFDGSLVHELYGKRWIKQVDELGLAHVNYSSSVNTFCKNKESNNPALMNEDLVEVYVHPVLVGEYFIDNYTGGTHMEDGFARSGLDKVQFITSADL